MAAFKHNIKLDQGATNRELFTWKTGTPAVPVDLSGCTARSQVRATKDSTEVLVELSTTDDSIVLGGALGTVELIFSPESTIGATWKSGVYDVEITLSNTDIRRLVEGSVSLSSEVTRD